MTTSSLTPIATTVPAYAGMVAVSPVITFHPEPGRPGRPGLSALELHKAFLAVAEHGSVNKAADALYMVQSGVSLRLRVLEKRLGVELFARKRGRPAQLTAVGQDVLEKLLDMRERGCLAVPIRVLVYPKCGHMRIEAVDNPHLTFDAAGATVGETAVYVCWKCFTGQGRLRQLGPGDRFLYPKLVD